MPRGQCGRIGHRQVASIVVVVGARLEHADQPSRQSAQEVEVIGVIFKHVLEPQHCVQHPVRPQVEQEHPFPPPVFVDHRIGAVQADAVEALAVEEDGVLVLGAIGIDRR